MDYAGFKTIIGNRPNAIDDSVVKEWLNSFCNCLNSLYPNSVTKDELKSDNGQHKKSFKNNVICRDINKLSGKDIQEYEHIFAHELFHAIHYYFGKTELAKRLDYTSRVVKESLASYFEYTYCDLKNFYNTKCALKEDWDEISVVDYPYSGARYFLGDSHFNDILKISTKDMDKALRELMTRYAGPKCSIKQLSVIEKFYGVKNK